MRRSKYLLIFGLGAIAMLLAACGGSDSSAPGGDGECEVRAVPLLGAWVDASAPGTYRRPFRKRAVQLEEDVRVDSFLLQYNPVRSADVPESNQFQGELHFDRPIVALILQKKLLDESDGALAFPESDFRGILHRGINTRDVVTLSDDRRVLKIAVDIQDGVDQIRVLVASDNIPQPQSK